ncbi:unnamed protein product [Mytilus coruscus]|uniref:B box-type domain-containing protein n=1 Tax=Mytilus coruscus TaxID=42192 RepID=A0A6J8CW63_MYTCO|nr:unnamed protein product [Mytilus coruscus]
MATNTSVCAICDLRHVTSRSIHWCPECEEALCSDCSEHHSLSKGTRSHKTIPISQYQSLPTFVTDIQQFCKYHNEKYQQYCMKHECPICYKCIKEHGKCTEVIPLEDVMGEIKSSELFRELKQSLGDVLENIKIIRGDREDNVQSIRSQKKKITMEIDSIKTRINQHLDKLKESLMKELELVYDNYKYRIQSIISSLGDQEDEIKRCSTELENITKYASDLQTFLGMRNIQSKVTDNEKRLRSMIEKQSVDNVDLRLSINDKIHDIFKSIKKFGSIIIKKSPSACITIPIQKTRQAQISAPNRMQSINTISVYIKQKLHTACYWPSGCSRTRTGRFFFTDYGTSLLKLVSLNSQGKTDYEINLSTSFSSFDVVCDDENTVAVTTGHPEDVRQRHDLGICFVDLTKKKVTQFFALPGYPYGITYNGTSLICCVKNKNIHIVSCTDNSITTIPNTVLPMFSYVATYADKILYTNPDRHKVFCCCYDGTPVWEFNDCILETPRGITVDDRGNVFVAGCYSSNVIVISADGKQFKQILNKENGLNKPNAIFFDKLRNQLLVTNNSSIANLYDITYS